MARPSRIEYSGAFYHVIVRGNQRQNIFFDEHDRIAFLDRISYYKEKCGFVLYAYVLMSNHVHLLVETPKAPLSKIMQLINFTYTRYVNKKYGKIGHLFQGRYKAFLCDRDEYLLSLVRYIHLNPVRARMVAHPHEYQWSSHNDYLNKKMGKIIDTDRVLRLFSESMTQARGLYKLFVDEALGAGRDESLYRAIDQQILGDEKFMEKLEKKIDNPDKPIRKPSFQTILKAIEDLTGVKREEIASRNRKADVVFARELLVGVSREVGYKMVALQPVLKRGLSMLSRLSTRAESEKGQTAKRKVMKILNS